MKRIAVAAVCLIALACASGACASTRLDATKVAWYMKGEGDLALPHVSPPQRIEMLKCAPTRTRVVRCTNRTVTIDGRNVYCDEGNFVIDRFGVDGQWHMPHACNRRQKS